MEELYRLVRGIKRCLSEKVTFKQGPEKWEEASEGIPGRNNSINKDRQEERKACFIQRPAWMQHSKTQGKEIWRER